RQSSAQQGLAHRPFDSALGNAESNAHQGNDQWNDEDISPMSMRCGARAICKTRLCDCPTCSCTQQASQPQIEPALEQNAAALRRNRDKLFRSLVNRAVYLGAG